MGTEGTPLEGLKSFVRRKPAAESCALCAAPLTEPHPHLFDRTQQSLACACAACALLFTPGQTGRYVPVPHRGERLETSPIDDLTWESLGLPIGLAFFAKSSAEGRVVAWYPGPAGATRCHLTHQPLALALEDDVEAILVNRLEGASAAYRVSIDECFALVGLIRARWRGFSGGAGVRESIARFLERLETGAAHGH
jgi:hypothetical protein